MRRIVLVLGTLIVPMLTSCGWVDIAGAPRALATKASLEVYAVSPTNIAGARAATNPGTGLTIYLTQPPIISTSDVATVQRSGDSPEMAELAVQLTPAGAQKMAAATSPPRRQQLAIVVNGEVMSVATVNAALSESFVVGGIAEKERDEAFEALTEE